MPPEGVGTSSNPQHSRVAQLDAGGAPAIPGGELRRELWLGRLWLLGAFFSTIPSIVLMAVLLGFLRLPWVVAMPAGALPFVLVLAIAIKHGRRAWTIIRAERRARRAALEKRE